VALAHGGEHLPRLVAHAEQGHEERLQPEVEHGLRPEPAVLRPPERDPVAPREDLARDLAIVGLPRIDQRVTAEARQVEGRDREHEPEAVTPDERARRAGFVEPKGAERLSHAIDPEHREQEREGHREARGREVRERLGGVGHGADGARHGGAQRGPGAERARGEHEARAPEGAQVGARDDARLGIVERAERVEHAERRDERGQRREGDPEREARRPRHHHERDERGRPRDQRAARETQAVASRQQGVSIVVTGLAAAWLAVAVIAWLAVAVIAWLAVAVIAWLAVTWLVDAERIRPFGDPLGGLGLSHVVGPSTGLVGAKLVGAGLVGVARRLALAPSPLLSLSGHRVGGQVAARAPREKMARGPSAWRARRGAQPKRPLM
jgi:hypothetical protein